jgi:heat-inducible transcriptional repressor
MANISERQKIILALIIRDYIEGAQPVGSNRLVDNYGLNFSSATVRNEMAALTEKGFLRQPHTSAGRVPTEEGYRYFVSRLMGNTELPSETRRTIIHQFYQTGLDIDHWMKLAASVLAHQAQAASLVTAPRAENVAFKHVELISTLGRQVLMVLVYSNGEVNQQMLSLAEPVEQEQLSDTASSLNRVLAGKGESEIESLVSRLNALEQDVVKLVLEDMRQRGMFLTGEIYRDGLTNVLAEPEFEEAQAARNALRILEEKTFLDDLLSRTVMGMNMGGVHVMIGGEGNWEELRDFSMVLSRYGTPGLASGTLGVLGPMRMPYGRTISTVRFVAGLLSDLVSNMLEESYQT